MEGIDASPRFSATQLAEYVFRTPAGKIAILKDQKLGNEKRTYYGRATNGILAAFMPNTGSFQRDILRNTELNIRTLPAPTANKATKLSSNAEMIKRFAELSSQLKLPDGHHEIIRRNATIELKRVRVSVRPEILTIKNRDRSLVLTKLRFSKDEMSADVSEIILLILLRYGDAIKDQGRGGFDVKASSLIDCYARRIIHGHALPTIRERQLDQALEQIVKLWPRITPMSRASDFF